MEESRLKQFLNNNIFIKTRQGNQYSIDVVYIGDGSIEGIDKYGSVVVINLLDIEIVEQKKGGRN